MNTKRININSRSFLALFLVLFSSGQSFARQKKASTETTRFVIIEVPYNAAESEGLQSTSHPIGVAYTQLRYGKLEPKNGYRGEFEQFKLYVDGDQNGGRMLIVVPEGVSAKVSDYIRSEHLGEPSSAELDVCLTEGGGDSIPGAESIALEKLFSASSDPKNLSMGTLHQRRITLGTDAQKNHITPATMPYGLNSVLLLPNQDREERKKPRVFKRIFSRKARAKAKEINQEQRSAKEAEDVLAQKIDDIRRSVEESPDYLATFTQEELDIAKAKDTKGRFWRKIKKHGAWHKADAKREALIAAAVLKGIGSEIQANRSTIVEAASLGVVATDGKCHAIQQYIPAIPEWRATYGKLTDATVYYSQTEKVDVSEICDFTASFSMNGQVTCCGGYPSYQHSSPVCYNDKGALGSDCSIPLNEHRLECEETNRVLNSVELEGLSQPAFSPNGDANSAFLEIASHKYENWTYRPGKEISK